MNKVNPKKIESSKYFYLIFFIAVIINGITDCWLNIYPIPKTFPIDYIYLIISTIKLLVIYFILNTIILKIRKKSKNN